MARKRDPAEIETDAIIAKIESRLKVEYAQAEREIAEKVTDYYRRYDTKLKTWERWVDEGKKSQADFDKWKVGQLTVGKRWEDMRDQLAHDLYNTNQIAHSIAKGYMPEVYAINHNYGTFECEKGSGVDTSYTLYSREAVENIFRENPQMLPDPGETVSKDIAEGKAIRWNNQHIQSVAIQSILQGNNISDMATRLANAVGKSDRAAAIRNARTMATGTQNRARRDAYKRASDRGIDVRIMWLATLDMRTRHSHRQMDQMITDVDKPFEFDDEAMGHVSIMYPGQPKPGEESRFPQSMIWNCRCTLRAIVKGLERMSGTSGDLDTSKIEGMTYDEWKASKKEKTQPILRPDQRQDAARAGYIREYAENPDMIVPSGRNRTLDIDARRQIMAAPSRAGESQTSYAPRGGMSLESTMDAATYDQYVRKLGKAPEDIINLHDIYGANYKYQTVGAMDACFDPDTGTISYATKGIGKGVNKFGNLAHECGHAFDFGMDGNVEGMTFDELADINRIIYGSERADLFRPSQSDAFLAAMREDVGRLWDMVESDKWKDINRDLLEHDTSKGVQDFIDGIMGNKKIELGVKLSWAHGNEYYDREYNNLSDSQKESLVQKLTDMWGYADSDNARDYMREYETASELWANIQGALTDGGKEEEYMRRFARSSIDAFLDIIGRV